MGVGRTQLSDTGVCDEQTIVGQVTWGVAGEGPVDKSHSLAWFLHCCLLLMLDID